MKLLVDTSVWIDHLKNNNDQLVEILADDSTVLVTHQMVTCELLLGGIKENAPLLESLKSQERANEATSEEVTSFIINHNQELKGVGLIDCHILTACLINEAAVFTLDKKLQEAGKRIGVATV